jgi:hypothetical protein
MNRITVGCSLGYPRRQVVRQTLSAVRTVMKVADRSRHKLHIDTSHTADGNPRLFAGDLVRDNGDRFRGKTYPVFGTIHVPGPKEVQIVQHGSSALIVPTVLGYFALRLWPA